MNDILGSREEFWDRGFSLCPPKDWEKTDWGKDDPTKAIKYLSPQQDCSMVIEITKSGHTNFNEYIQGLKHNLSAIFPNYSLEEERFIPFKDMQAYRFIFSYGDDNSQKNRCFHHLIYFEGQVYSICYYAGPKIFERYRDIIEASIQSFEFISN